MGDVTATDEKKIVDGEGKEPEGNGEGAGDSDNKSELDKSRERIEALEKENETLSEQKKKWKTRAKKKMAKDAKDSDNDDDDVDDGVDIDAIVDERLRVREEKQAFQSAFPDVDFDEVKQYAEDKDLSYKAAYGAMLAEKGEDPAVVARASAGRSSVHGGYRGNSGGDQNTEVSKIIASGVPKFMQNKEKSS